MAKASWRVQGADCYGCSFQIFRGYRGYPSRCDDPLRCEHGRDVCGLCGGRTGPGRRDAFASDPGKESLDDPPPWINGEADLIGVLAHDFNGNQRGLGNLLTRIAAVSEDPLDEREDATRGPQKRSAAIAILDVRRMGFEHEATPLGIDKGMTLASIDLLAGVVAARAAGLGRLDALAVDDCACGAGLASGPFAVKHDQGVIDFLEALFVAERRKPAIDRAPWR